MDLSRARFVRALIVLLSLGAAIRLAYLWSEPRYDPAYDRPMLDGAYYLARAREIAGGLPGPAGAHYLGPLFPYFLALLLLLFGESFFAIHLGQHVLMLGACGLLAQVAAREVGREAALAAAGLLVLHQPLLFFASRPLSEPLALMLLALGLFLVGRPSVVAGVGAGASLGLAACARPGLLLVAPVWVVGEWVARGSRRGAIVGLGILLPVLPVTWRNLVASGHLVPISSNFGMTAYQGNAPGATGTHTRIRGLSGDPLLQRDEATAIARARSGLALDDVEADRWWGRKALAHSLDHPADTLRLLLRRGLLLVDDWEHGLDDHPRVDDNPWRLTLRIGSDANAFGFPLVPFALLFGLSAFAVTLVGFRGSGGWCVWSTLAACAATPLLFYVSSRYRLPAAALLAIPAGRGLALLPRALREDRPARRWGAATVGLSCMLLSLFAAPRGLRDPERATALVNRASLQIERHDLSSARRDLGLAEQHDPRSPAIPFGRGVVATIEGRSVEAEEWFRRALTLDPTHPGAAGNLSLLLLARGEPAAALPLLRGALADHPTHRACWSQLVRALEALGDAAGAREAAREAASFGVVLD